MSIAFMLPVIDRDIEIDWDILETTHPNSQAITNLGDQFSSFEANIPRYLTMCCNTRSIISELCSGFRALDIPSNPVHAWISPPLWDFNMKNSPLNEAYQYDEAIARGCISRQPSLAPIYLGAAMMKVFGLVVHL